MQLLAACMTKKTNSISRRATIAGAIASTIPVAEAAAPDPIFPVLERFRLAQQAHSKAVKAGDLPTEQSVTAACVKKAQLDLLTTMPTTCAGLAALLARLGHVEGPSANIEPVLLEAMCWDDETREAACTVLIRLAGLVLKIA